MDENKVKRAPVDGVAVAYAHGGGDVFWTCSADPHLEIAYKVFQTGGGQATQIASSARPGAVQVDFGMDGLDGHLLWWEFQCRSPRGTPGRWPVHVQFFQVSPGGDHRPISQVLRYEVPVGSVGHSSVADHVMFRAAA
jgi:hypothetical protein